MTRSVDYAIPPGRKSFDLHPFSKGRLSELVLVEAVHAVLVEVLPRGGGELLLDHLAGFIHIGASLAGAVAVGAQKVQQARIHQLESQLACMAEGEGVGVDLKIKRLVEQLAKNLLLLRIHISLNVSQHYVQTGVVLERDQLVEHALLPWDERELDHDQRGALDSQRGDLVAVHYAGVVQYLGSVNDLRLVACEGLLDPAARVGAACAE